MKISNVIAFMFFALSTSSYAGEFFDLDLTHQEPSGSVKRCEFEARLDLGAESPWVSNFQNYLINDDGTLRLLNFNETKTEGGHRYLYSKIATLQEACPSKLRGVLFKDSEKARVYETWLQETGQGDAFNCYWSQDIRMGEVDSVGAFSIVKLERGSELDLRMRIKEGVVYLKFTAIQRSSPGFCTPSKDKIKLKLRY